MELYASGKGHHQAACVVFLTSFISAILTSDCAPAKLHRSVSDECDWIGSGLDNRMNGGGVQPVYLRCREGIVEWQYPVGALRIILRMGHQSGKEFKGCLRVDPGSSGATLYQEGPQSLKYLYGVTEENDVVVDKICFKSARGHVALYLEAQASHDDLRKDVFRLLYDLEPIKENGHSECRPCSDKELLYLFCTSDFVARGFISSLYQNEISHQTELTIHSQEVLRESEPKVFSHRLETSKNDTYFVGTVNRPLHCGTKVGSGEFLFVGRWKLGVPILICAPRWTEWEKVKQAAIESDNFDCILE